MSNANTAVYNLFNLLHGGNLSIRIVKQELRVTYKSYDAVYKASADLALSSAESALNKCLDKIGHDRNRIDFS